MAAKKTTSKKKAVAKAAVKKAAPAPAKRVPPVELSPASRTAIAAMQNAFGVATADDAIAIALRLSKSLESAPRAASHLVVVELDTDKKEYRFANSDALELRGWLGTESDLVTQAAKKTNLSVPAIVREGALLFAKRELAMAQRAATRAKEPVPADGTRRSTSGITGAADGRIKAAYERLKTEEPNGKITPARLAGAAGTGFHTAKRWLDRNVDTAA